MKNTINWAAEYTKMLFLFDLLQKERLNRKNQGKEGFVIKTQLFYKFAHFCFTLSFPLVRHPFPKCFLVNYFVSINI